jgi:hypothetical protein
MILPGVTASRVFEQGQGRKPALRGCICSPDLVFDRPSGGTDTFS